MVREPFQDEPKETKEEQKPLIKLDERFLFVVRIVWRAFRGVFWVIKQILRVCGVGAKTAAPVSEEEALKQKPIAEPDTRSFSHYGGLRWVSDLAPTRIRENNRLAWPKPDRLDLQIGGVNFDVLVFGARDDEQLDMLGAAIESAVARLGFGKDYIKEVDVIEDLGFFLNAAGQRDDPVRGFTISGQGQVMISEYTADDVHLLPQFLAKILQSERVRLSMLKKAHDALWNQRQTIAERLELRHDFTKPDTRSPYGYLRGLPVIDMDTVITGGVYLGVPSREAIVMTESEILSGVFAELMSRLRKLKEASGLGLEELVLRTVKDIVQKKLPRNTLQAVKDVRDENRNPIDEELHLDVFLKRETGDSEHQALLAGYLLERLHKEQDYYLSGTVSIERNWFPGGGHHWIRYTAAGGDVYILDPRRDLVRRLDEYSEERWPYERLGDLTLPPALQPVRLKHE